PLRKFLTAEALRVLSKSALTIGECANGVGYAPDPSGDQCAVLAGHATPPGGCSAGSLHWRGWQV
ncbi:MAG: hypothetical protein ACRC0L_04350, partial [Angustibacter sp.]